MGIKVKKRGLTEIFFSENSNSSHRSYSTEVANWRTGVECLGESPQIVSTGEREYKGPGTVKKESERVRSSNKTVT